MSLNGLLHLVLVQTVYLENELYPSSVFLMFCVGVNVDTLCRGKNVV
jgi:hypothetical protein